ncbi:MAG: acyl carrier protein [Desulfomonile tiedjei]|nr:acyl carrier protein [Desulfomonile tiedjei]
MTRDDVVEVLLGCLSVLAQEEPDRFKLDLSEETILFGYDAGLDSLGLVMLLLSVEEALHARHGVSVPLMDERALSQRHSPFRTVRTLTDYIIANFG